MTDLLTPLELLALVQRVFVPGPQDRALAIMVDLPDAQTPDHPAWLARRSMALDWASGLAQVKDRLGLSVHLYLYRNVQHNNADLPAGAWAHRFGPLPETADSLDDERQEPFESIFATHQILLAPTQFSATAPMKVAARKHGFRAATMPGFSPAMIPALKLDYGIINARCRKMKSLLDAAQSATFHFHVDDRDDQHLTLDLRYRTSTASGGLFPDPGVAGNLPSGETYIVPYEGENPNDPSRSEGVLPVQLGDEIVLYRIRNNRADSVLSEGPRSREEQDHLTRDPAYGNLAELGLGVLSDFGLEPTGEILLDEKLGLHIAFGRSDHFGGQVGPGDFASPESVIHIDRVYIPQTQPRIRVVAVDLHMPDGPLPLIRNNDYVINWT